MKVCYLVLVHHKFPQAIRLLRRLAEGGETGFVLHIDAGADLAGARLLRREVAPLGPVYAPSVRARWGGYGQARAIMSCVQAAANGRSYDRYCLISGQDYPLTSNAAIVAFFAHHAELEYIEAFPQDLSDALAPGWSPYYRFRRYHIWVGNHRRVLPWLRRGEPPLPIYHGSTWWALTRPALRYVAERFVADVALRRYLRTGFLVDEAYVPTILKNSPLAGRLADANVTFARWIATSGPHPCVLRSGDLPELLASGKLFARKFDSQVDELALDRLDELHSGTSTDERTGKRVARL